MGATGFLLILFAYFVVVVITPMTQPSSLFERFSEQVLQETIKNSSDKEALATTGARASQARLEKSSNAADRLREFVVMLEFANADIRAKNAQIAFSLLSGMALSITGILLFAVGAQDAIRLGAEKESLKLRLSATAPGTVSLLLGGIILLAGVMKPTTRPFDAYMKYDTDQRMTIGSKKLSDAPISPPLQSGELPISPASENNSSVSGDAAP